MEQKNISKRRKYNAGFKEEVLKIVMNGRPVSEIARSLNISENLTYRWKSHNGSRQNTPVMNTTSVSVSVEDDQALHKRIREL